MTPLTSSPRYSAIDHRAENGDGPRAWLHVIEIDVASPPPEYLTDPYGEEFTLTVGPFLTVVQHGNSYVLRAIAWSSAPTLRPVQRGLLEGHLNEGCALSSL